MRMEQRLSGGPFDADRLLYSMELSKLGVRSEFVPPRFKSYEVIEVNHDVTGRCGWPENLDESIDGDTVTVSEVDGHVGQVLTGGDALAGGYLEPSMHPVDGNLLTPCQDYLPKRPGSTSLPSLRRTLCVADEPSLLIEEELE